MALEFTGERIVPGAANCEPTFADKMYHEHAARYLFAAQVVHGKRVLDVGCGVGYGSALLADAGAAEVVSFDVAPDAIEHARTHYARPTVTFSVDSAESFDLGAFDVITCFELIEHVSSQQAVLERIARSLGDEGVAFISTPRPANDAPRSAFHAHELAFEEFRSLLEGQFRSVAFWFEGNQFGSRIDLAAGTPTARVTMLKPDQFEPENADYFVAVVGHQLSEFAGLQPVLVQADDAYVLTLEHDVAVLRDIERRLGEENRALGRQFDRERHRRVDAERLVEEMLQSKSWRITAPLRSARGTTARIARFKRRVSDARTRRGTAGALAAAGARALERVKRGSFEQPPWSDVPLTDRRTLTALDSRVIDVAFLIGCWDGQSKRYRVGNLADGLRELGYAVLVLADSDGRMLIEHDIRPKRLVIFRAPLVDDGSSQVDVIRHVHRNGGSVVADFDDLVFDPAIVHEIDGFRRLSEADQRDYMEGVFGYRRMVDEVDLVTCPTAYLAERLRSLGVEAAVIPNSLDRAQLNLAERLVAQPRSSDQPIVRVGYLSGTRTHQADFGIAARAIERVLDERSGATFTVIGYLDLPPSWSRFGSRVAQLPFVDYLELLRLTRSFDITIAPLVIGQAFCEAKSELKIFESGIVEVPTVASATASYTAAIEDGVDGFLARSEEEWSEKVTKLVDSVELRGALGRRARERALTSYTYEAATSRFIEAVRLEQPEREISPPGPPGDPGVGKKITWIVPGLIIGGGGHRNIFRAAYQLEQAGYEIALYFTEWDKDERELATLVRRHFYPLKAEMKRYEGRIAPCDVLFATHWSTVRPALDNRSQAHEVMYFVQDFEPLFYPMGTEYLLAENTYRQGLYHITSGPWCERMLRSRFGAEADHFQFPVDTNVYFPRERTDAHRRILYFAKPEMPRRCYDLGVAALREFSALRPDVEIVFFGSSIRTGALGFPVRAAGLLGLEELAELYANSDLGIVFSPTNPSLVPYEMMACGLPVVDLKADLAELNYGDRDDIALLVEPDPARIALAVADLLADEHELQLRRVRSQEFAATFPSEEEMGARIRQLIEARLEQTADDLRPVVGIVS
jgi:glycosyltransferase involved in cell wall biosynthesis